MTRVPQQGPQQDGIRLRRTDGGDLSWEDIATGEIRLTATFYRPWSVLNDENKLRLLNALSALGSTETVQEPDVDVQLLAWAVTNCHALARRRIRAGVDLEYWEHVQRICEKAGAQSKGVLRASLPTEITEGSGNEQAWKDLAADGGLPESQPPGVSPEIDLTAALSASRIDPPVPSPELQPCEACGGAGTVPVGEHFVTLDMAIDAGEPSMEGTSCGVEFGPCEVCGGSGAVPSPGGDTEVRRCSKCHATNVLLLAMSGHLDKVTAAGGYNGVECVRLKLDELEREKAAAVVPSPSAPQPIYLTDTVEALRRQLDDVDEALGAGYFPSNGTGRVRAIQEWRGSAVSSSSVADSPKVQDGE